MHGLSKADELIGSPINPNTMEPMSTTAVTSATSSGGGGGGNRTRRTGLLTVMERPPGRIFVCIQFLFPKHHSRFVHDFACV